MADSSGSSTGGLFADDGPAAGEPYGIAGWFDTPAGLYHACEKLRDKGYLHFDAQTPFPVHGLEKAMGLKPSPLPWFVLCGGAVGLSSGIALTYYTNYDYAMNVGGKPPFSWQIYIPVYFELTILLSALTCFFGLWILCGLPRFFHPTMTHKTFTKTTTDAFFLCVEAKDAKYDAAKTRALLEELGARDVEEVSA